MMSDSQYSAERILLSIAIPTYNRARFLNQVLGALHRQAHKEHRVEVIVSDNASTDETPFVVEHYQNLGLSIRYIRNSKNLGADGNILQCFHLAGGKYVWIFSDDDVLEPGGLTEVLAHLSSSDKDYDLVHIAARGFSGHYADRGLTVARKLRLFMRAEDLACHVHIHFTFISGNIINKERVLSLPHSPFDQLLGTHLVQLGWIFTVLEHHRISLFIEDPLIASLTDNSGGYAFFEVFGRNLNAITDNWLSSERVKRIIIRGALQRYFPMFLLRQNTKLSSFLQEDPHQILRPLFCRDARYWIFDFPIIKLPEKLANIWFFVVRVINKLDKMMGYPLLRY